MNSRTGRLFFVSGEPSGDLHGSLILSHLKRMEPSLQTEGIGGPLMKSAGLECLYSIEDLAVIGFVEVVKNLGHLLRVFGKIKHHLEETRPDLLILIDYPGFNVRLAEVAKAMGIRVIYFICPQVWAWHASRIRKIIRAIDEAVVVFSFEVDIWKKAGVEVNWFGHPLVGIVESKIPVQAFRNSLGISGGPVISLLPGSRTQEIYYILPRLLTAAENILRSRPNTRFLLPLAGTIDETLVRPYLVNRNLPIIPLRGQTYEAIQASDLAIVASGTATLETAILGTPMIIVYQTNWLTSILSKFLIQSPHIGLPNVLSRDKVVPEFVRWKFHPDAVAAEALSILADKGRQDEIKTGLKRVRQSLGEKGASSRVANHILLRLREMSGK
ncbi:lipid-A-disaccharide synthase [bacterium]|nr:lipid-A-disaccharide synthase [bacterium]